MIREVIVDFVLFLKNVGKLSKKMFFYLKRILKGIWKRGFCKIDDLKCFMKCLKDDFFLLKLRCKCGMVFSCLIIMSVDLIYGIIK